MCLNCRKTNHDQKTEEEPKPPEDALPTDDKPEVDVPAVAKVSEKFTTSPWTLSVGGLVEKPRTFTTEDLVAMFKPEARVYRLRCVEGWSMVIPWVGLPLSAVGSLEAPSPSGGAV